MIGRQRQLQRERYTRVAYDRYVDSARADASMARSRISFRMCMNRWVVVNPD